MTVLRGRVIAQICWLILLVDAWLVCLRYIPIVKSRRAISITVNLLFGLLVLLQLVYIQITIYTSRRYDTVIREQLQDADDEAEDILRDPRDSTPYERVQQTRPPEL